MKFLLSQVLVVALMQMDGITCQYHQQQFPGQSHYQIQHHHQHPTSRPQEHHDYRPQPTPHPSNQDYQPSPPPFDFSKFNQQAKQLQSQLHYLNEQQQQHIQQQINSVHHDGSGPQFDFAVNGNYTDLEQASEQFVNLAHWAGKQNIPPKVIKITKTVAVKQHVPVPYAVPVEVSHPGFHGHHIPSSTPRPSPDYKPQSNYISSYPTQSPAPSEAYHHQNAAPSESYRHQHAAPSETYHHQQAPPSSNEYDTEPFYITTPQKETIKIVPVPYYVDDEGNKHEISPSSSSHASAPHDAHPHSHSHGEDFYPNRQTTSPSDGSGKFQSYHFSYHPPTPATQHAHHAQHPQHYHQQSHGLPETKYVYNHDSDNSASSDSAQQYAADEPSDENQHYQYKYVTYE